MTTEHDLESVRAALSEGRDNFVALLRGARNVESPAIGDWTVGDVATHIALVCEAELVAANGMAPPPEAWGDLQLNPAAVAGFNATAMTVEDKRGMQEHATEIEERITELVDALKDREGEIVHWLGGVKMPLWAVGGHLVSELAIHGFDIARAKGLPWEIAPYHAALGMDFFAAFLGADPAVASGFIDKHAAKGLNARFEMRLRGQGSSVYSFRDGDLTIGEPSEAAVDCIISADPAALMLVAYNRTGMWGQVFRGRIAAFGRKPWLAPRLTKILATP